MMSILITRPCVPGTAVLVSVSLVVSAATRDAVTLGIEMFEVAVEPGAGHVAGPGARLLKSVGRGAAVPPALGCEAIAALCSLTHSWAACPSHAALNIVCVACAWLLSFWPSLATGSDDCASAAAGASVVLARTRAIAIRELK